MKQRLILEKVNAATGDMATYAETNGHLILAPRKKELRHIAASDLVKGKHFFLESDIKGPALTLDNTGRAILTAHSAPGSNNQHSNWTSSSYDFFQGLKASASVEPKIIISPVVLYICSFNARGVPLL